MGLLQLVCAGFRNLPTGGSDHVRQIVHMRRLVLGDLCEAAARPRRISGFDKVLLRVLGESLVIKRVFNVLQVEGEVEDINGCQKNGFERCVCGVCRVKNVPDGWLRLDGSAEAIRGRRARQSLAPRALEYFIYG